MGFLKGRDLLSLSDLKAEEILQLLDLARKMKSGQVNIQSNKLLGLLFYKPSTRTRVSFWAAMSRLGGKVLDLNPALTQESRGEPLSDMARVLSKYLDVLAIRTFGQEHLEEYARYANIPVINALSDFEHPCQVLADLLTIQECFGSFSDLTLTYLGDGNNISHSLLLACALVGMNVRVATPQEYQPNLTVLEKAKAIAQGRTEVQLLHDPKLAIQDAQIIYTDMWASMGQDDSGDMRLPLFEPYQVNDELLSNVGSETIVMHCLPARRGEEITEEVIEGSRSRVWQEAENRMHIQQALLASLLGDD
ncbi:MULTISPECIES: ornithine carbamoyltransferase [Moorena]|uniref:ornithine carbamoyltransferase n=1 Tax=Moorena TaxID=1155738 RepID=UPI001055E6A9|nr:MULTISPECIES: ornithine carbamoyltransferase [Moorena]NEP33339.1 ornithine carbamoyltransferase [Moorena sp. SIO3B2]NEP69613.1 ornithine carbamoyltransferase [Moorena sp. SIO3A5]NEQ06146.1 ornithine carbamoyltransferase [Moorena sp. SIO4E2]NER89467.1 ornithine carbamoyltransferase [Moorena sp. SIO3A2]NET67818.1 ornithine carbamoyltransferase [Moorena sp. SIO1G6]